MLCVFVWCSVFTYIAYIADKCTKEAASRQHIYPEAFGAYTGMATYSHSLVLMAVHGTCVSEHW